MTHDSPSLLRLCPVHPGNPRRNIEGESPHLWRGTYSLAALAGRLLLYRCRVTSKHCAAQELLGRRANIQLYDKPKEDGEDSRYASLLRTARLQATMMKPTLGIVTRPAVAISAGQEPWLRDEEVPMVSIRTLSLVLCGLCLALSSAGPAPASADCVSECLRNICTPIGRYKSDANCEMVYSEGCRRNCPPEDQGAQRVNCGQWFCRQGFYCGHNYDCIPIGNLDCGSFNCPAGFYCGSRQSCIPEGAVDCGNGSFCPNGVKCPPSRCIPSTQ
jgi:hypothetical protein